MIYTTHNHYYNNLKNPKYWRQQIIGVHKNIGAGKMHENIGAGKICKNIGAYKNLGVDKTLLHTKT
jgi:hypothetical protein